MCRSWPMVFLAVVAVASGAFAQQVSETETTPEKTTASLKEAFQGAFKVGTAVNRSVTTGRGFRRSDEDVQADIKTVKQQFNHLVAENDMKWQMIHPRPGSDGYDFTAADALVEFAQQNNMELAGHTLVWHSQTPNWVFEGTHQPDPQAPSPPDVAPERQGPPPGPPPGFGPPPGGAPPGGGPPAGGSPGGGPPGGGPPGGFGRFRGFDLKGPRASREELLERMREHIFTVVGRYKGKVKVWDVVNEAIADNGDEMLRRSPWSVIIGPDFIAKAFEYAHEADPDAILRYNDYGLENPEKRAKLIKLVKRLQEQKVPISAIGSQAHLNVTISYESMDQTLTELASLGLPIHITELDVNSAVGGQRGFGADINANAGTTEGGLVEAADKRLADAYAGIFRAFMKHRDKVDVVTFWGINDAVSWRARGTPLLFDGRNQPKPAFQAVLETATATKPNN